VTGPVPCLGPVVGDARRLRRSPKRRARKCGHECQIRRNTDVEIPRSVGYQPRQTDPGPDFALKEFRVLYWTIAASSKDLYLQRILRVAAMPEEGLEPPTRGL
ncbi:MAG: hypothetical protein ACXVSF_06520, partial [Solirubrobacteraceae bacterium]